MLAAFAHHLPAWVGPDGYPLSWRHYVVGLRWLALHTMRVQVAAAEAVRLGGAVKEDYQRWRDSVGRTLEVRR